MEDAFEVFHIGILVAITLCLTQADTVDDGGVVQRITDDRIFGAEEGLEDPTIGIEASGVENGILRVEVASNGLLELLVDVLRTADEANGAHPKAVAVHSGLSGGDQARMVGETEVVICAEVDHFLPRADLDISSLRGRDNSFALVETSFVNSLKFLSEVLLHILKHSRCFFVYSLIGRLLSLRKRKRGATPYGESSRSYRASSQ